MELKKRKRKRRKRKTMAAADSGVKPLQGAMKMAKVAIQLEGANRHQEAYYEYLRTINYISQALLQEEKKEMVEVEEEVEVERMLRLAEQCLDRAKSFIGKRSDLPSSTCSSADQSEASPADVNTASATESQTDGALGADSPTMSALSDGGGELSSFPPPDVFQRLQTAASPDSSKKELTPIEEASRLNQKLKANYEARVARLSPGQAYQKTSLVSLES